MGCVRLDPEGMHIGCRCIVSLWLTAVQRWSESLPVQTSSQLLQASREALMSRWLFEQLDTLSRWTGRGRVLETREQPVLY